MTTSRRNHLLLLLLLPCASIGCNRGPELHRVSGKVTYGGKPVQAGRVLFEPDTSKGNSGIAGYAVISKGEYDTAREGGQGSIGGAMLVKIDAFDGVPQGERIPTPLFPETQVRQIELPRADSKQDFSLPKP